MKTRQSKALTREQESDLLRDRTCVVSRRRSDPSGLVRLVLSSHGELFVDYRGRLPGRGAWVTPERSVLEALQDSPKLLNRALKASVDSSGLLEKVQEANQRHLLDALALAARAGVLASGNDAALGLVQSGKACAVVLASDASPRVIRRFSPDSSDVSVFPVVLNREQIGDRIGKGPRAVVAVAAGASSNQLLRELRRMAALR